MDTYVLDFTEVDGTQVGAVGGKGASLGELSRIDGIDVPPGFCVTTAAFRRFMVEAPSIDDPLDRLAQVAPDDQAAIRKIAAEVRGALDGAAMPDDLAAAITAALDRLGGQGAYAVRSSSTAEDAPTASFAGQHDTYLNVVGTEILRHVRRCWASLFTDQAVAYRLRNGLDQRGAQMAVVVQRMVSPQAAGVLFTADPVTSDRKLSSVEATFGLGEALVSGRVNADVYKVRDDEVVAREIREQPTLTDEQVARLARVGRRIEAQFGRPQDIEWCLSGDEFQIVQSRPITTLFPIPPADDAENHVYVSVGHQQMMTDAMKPLGLSFWQLTTPRPMSEAGGRLFVDVTRLLASEAGRARYLPTAERSDPLTGDALRTIIDRDGFLPTFPDEAPIPRSLSPADPIETDPAIVTELIERSQASLDTLTRDIRTKAGSTLLEFIRADLEELTRLLTDPRSMPVIMAGMQAAWWLNEHLEEWLGEKNAADTLSQSVPHNVTAEMGLALLDVADAIRPHPEVVAFLEGAEDDTFLIELLALPGGPEAREAIEEFLDRYGMRCVGEIDITRPRWSERPAALLPIILSNVRNFEPGAHRRRFDQGLREAQAKEQEVLERLAVLPDGEQKAAETKHMIDQLRTFSGYREYPKYGMVSRYFIYKQALLAAAERLVEAGVLTEAEDIFFLRLRELEDVVRDGHLDRQLIDERRAEFSRDQTLTPPRVMTSDGEIVTGSYRRDVPAGALIGLPVSAGTIEGRARVIEDISQADLEPGDILVTTYTDPSWTPLFVTAAALVTEVGGLMTHGAVIAREYGLPAVVGVGDATHLIPDGTRIRVHGTDGYVELLQ